MSVVLRRTVWDDHNHLLFNVMTWLLGSNPLEFFKQKNEVCKKIEREFALHACSLREWRYCFQRGKFRILQPRGKWHFSRSSRLRVDTNNTTRYDVKCPALFRCPLLRINIFMHHACVCSLCIRGEHKAFGTTTYHDGRATPTQTFENINSHSRLFQLVQLEKCGRTIQELNWQVRRSTELRKRMKTSPSYGRVLHKISNFVISCCRFAESENGKEMYQNL